jgi:predicted nucleic acid-binding protein
MEGLMGIDYFPADLDVMIRAGHLRGKFGGKLHTPDAIHLATAMQQGADLFVTNDRVLAQLSLDGLQICLLEDAGGLLA